MLKENVLVNKITEIEINELQNKISEWNEKANFIKNKFNFDIPNYIIDEIIENEDSKNYSNLHYLINCAVVNRKITKDNGIMLKKEYNGLDTLKFKTH